MLKPLLTPPINLPSSYPQRPSAWTLLSGIQIHKRLPFTIYNTTPLSYTSFPVRIEVMDRVFRSKERWE